MSPYSCSQCHSCHTRFPSSLSLPTTQADLRSFLHNCHSFGSSVPDLSWQALRHWRPWSTWLLPSKPLSHLVVVLCWVCFRLSQAFCLHHPYPAWTIDSFAPYTPEQVEMLALPTVGFQIRFILLYLSPSPITLSLIQRPCLLLQPENRRHQVGMLLQLLAFFFQFHSDLKCCLSLV